MGTILFILLGLAGLGAVAYFGYRRLQEGESGFDRRPGEPDPLLDDDDDPLFSQPTPASGDAGVEEGLAGVAAGEEASEPAAAARPAPDTMEEGVLGPARVVARPESAPGEELIIAIYVLAPSGHAFAGADVRAALQAERLEYGAMGIYHRRSDLGAGAVFSVANAKEPGTLGPEELETLETPGLACFLRLPGPVEGAEALEQLLDGAKGLARHLGGDVYDESRSVLRAQTEEHLRERVRDHARRRKLAAADR